MYETLIDTRMEIKIKKRKIYKQYESNISSITLFRSENNPCNTVGPT